LGEVELAQKINRCCQSASDCESAPKRVFSKSHVEHCIVIVHSSFEITARHRDFVEVRRERGEIVCWQLHHLIEFRQATGVREFWGAHAPSRAVFGALAEHLCNTGFAIDFAAKAPQRAREGACAPQRCRTRVLREFL